MMFTYQYQSMIDDELPIQKSLNDCPYTLDQLRENLAIYFPPQKPYELPDPLDILKTKAISDMEKGMFRTWPSYPPVAWTTLKLIPDKNENICLKRAHENIPLPSQCDRYSLTRAQDDILLRSMSIENSA